MCGHVDVVPHEKYGAKFIGNCIYVCGAIDIKSQVSVMMSLLKHSTSSKKVALILISDEEIDGNVARKLLKIIMHLWLLFQMLEKILS